MKIKSVLFIFIVLSFHLNSSEVVRLEVNDYNFWTNEDLQPNDPHRIMYNESNNIKNDEYYNILLKKSLNILKNIKITDENFQLYNLEFITEFGDKSDGVRSIGAEIKIKGTEVKSFFDGIITETGYDPNVLKRYIVIRDRRSSLKIIYGNLDKIYYTKSSRVNSNDVIGLIPSNSNMYLIVESRLFINPKLIFDNSITPKLLTLNYFNQNENKYLLNNRFNYIVNKHEKKADFYISLLKQQKSLFYYNYKKIYNFLDMIKGSNSRYLGNFYKVEEDIFLKSPVNGKILSVNYSRKSIKLNIDIVTDDGVIVTMGFLKKVFVNRGDIVTTDMVIGSPSSFNGHKNTFFLGTRVDDLIVNSKILIE